MRITEEELRQMTERHLRNEVNRLAENYMKIYEEYHKTGSRDSAFLHDLANAIIGISAVLEVYARDGEIHSNYAIEKLKNSKSYIEACIKFYENKEENESE